MQKKSNTKDGITFMKSNRPDKKYVWIFKDGTKIHFGHPSYSQFKDSIGLGLYSHLDHKDSKRRSNYHARHKCSEPKNKKSASYLSCRYLR